MLVYILYGLFILSCLILIAAVLLQPGKSDAGALFTSSVSSTAFGPRGTLNVLAKITIISAAVFMLSAFLLSQPAVTGRRSVLETTVAPAESPQASPEASPGASPAAASPEQANTNPAATNANTAASNTGVAANTSSAASPAANTTGNTSAQNSANGNK